MGEIICKRCGGTLETWNDVCTASLIEMCPGFVYVELSHYPDGQTIDRSEHRDDACEVFDKAMAARPTEGGGNAG